MGRLAELGIEGDVEFVELELLEASNVRNVLRKLQPNEIYNLAAQSFVAISFELPLRSACAWTPWLKVLSPPRSHCPRSISPRRYLPC
jgi:GDP-D-mannose dehydratase